MKAVVRMPDIYIEDILTPNYDDLLMDVLDHKHNRYILKGGRGSLKSSCCGTAIPLVMVEPGNENVNALVLRKQQNTLRDSVYNQIVSGIDRLGLSDEFQAFVSPLKIVRKATGQEILFRGLDDPLKVKSIKPSKGYIGITWFEECDTFSGMKEIRSVQQSALRGGSRFWTFLSFNPPETRSNFMNQAVLNPGPDTLVHSSTYLEVMSYHPDWLGDFFISEAEALKESNPTAYANEYLGEATGTGGEVFTNIELREITDEEIENFSYTYQGLDFGWFPDPAHWSRVCYNPAQLTLYIFDELRVRKTPNRELWEMLQTEKGVTYSDLITADSAEPKSIGDFKSYGASMRPTIKGPDSVRYSMKWLQSLKKIVIDPVRCPESAKEFSEYEYERNSDDEIISGYPDANNHAIDSVRYALNNVWKRRGN